MSYHLTESYTHYCNLNNRGATFEIPQKFRLGKTIAKSPTLLMVGLPVRPVRLG